MTWQLLFWIELVIYWLAITCLLIAQKRQAKQIRICQKENRRLSNKNWELRQELSKL